MCGFVRFVCVCCLLFVGGWFVVFVFLSVRGVLRVGVFGVGRGCGVWLWEGWVESWWVMSEI